MFVTLNRGYSTKRKDNQTGIKAPDYYIFPIEYVKEIRDKNNDWGKITKSRMLDFVKYKNKWNLIKTKLKG